MREDEENPHGRISRANHPTSVIGVMNARGETTQLDEN
jgi:hypothetical protein